MRKIVQDYLEKPADKLLAEMTSEEQRWVSKQKAPKKSKAKKKAKEQDEPQEQEEPQEENF